MRKRPAKWTECWQRGRGHDAVVRSALRPHGTSRARHGVVNGHSMTFKSDRQVANEQTLDALLASHAPAVPLDGGVVLEFRAVFPPPKSASKKVRAAMLRGTEPHTKKPDLDNLTKQLKDAMTVYASGMMTGRWCGWCAKSGTARRAVGKYACRRYTNLRRRISNGNDTAEQSTHSTLHLLCRPDGVQRRFDGTSIPQG